ncbi:MAG: lantibiotic dehydratase [Saprospiraceae bacterium]
MNIFPLTLIRCGGLPLGIWAPLSGGMPDWTALQNDEQVSAEKLLLAFDEALESLPNSDLRTTIYNARKDFYQRRKLPGSNFIASLQTGRVCSQILACIDLCQIAQKKKQDAAIEFEENLTANYLQLQSIAQGDFLPRALLFASHDLLASLSHFAKKTSTQFDKKDRRTALSLLQYLTRAVFKTSPLGRFTTVQCKTLTNADQEPDQSKNRQDLNRVEKMQENVLGESWERLESKTLVSPNVAILPAIYEVLLREPLFYYSLNISLNPCITQDQGTLKGDLCWIYFDGEREAFQKIEQDPVAELVIKLLLNKHRKMAYQAFLDSLKTEVDATETELQSFINQLIDIGLLEWELPERGLSPGWCGTLSNYLAYLPASQVLTETSYLLQWLRTAARTLPFQTIDEAQCLQRDSLQATKVFLEKYGSEMPPIQPEQIFFEDTAQNSPMEWPEGTIEKLINQLAECWRQNEFHALPAFMARLYDFAEKLLPDGEKIDFIEFSKRFLAQKSSTNAEAPKNPKNPGHRGKIGALLQVFKENGEYKAVVNALYPGGGKLFARWLPLFPESVSTQLEAWQNIENKTVASFPWQGWSNANFQPVVSSVSVAVPDGRMPNSKGGRVISIGDLAVCKNKQGIPQLIEKQSNEPIMFNDLGLEAPVTRPPVMQILWHLGVPVVSSEALLPEGYVSEIKDGIRHSNRLTFQSLVIARESWVLPQEVWEKLFSNGEIRAEKIGLGVAQLKEFGVTRRFFGQFVGDREKPQFYDMESPISMLLFEKNLRGGKGNLRLTEMIPSPEQWLGDRVGEFVVEFQVAG